MLINFNRFVCHVCDSDLSTAYLKRHVDKIHKFIEKPVICKMYNKTCLTQDNAKQKHTQLPRLLEAGHPTLALSPPFVGR